MNIIQIDSGPNNDHVYFPFKNMQPILIKGRTNLFVFKTSKFVHYIVAECISDDIDNVRVKPIFIKRAILK